MRRSHLGVRGTRHVEHEAKGKGAAPNTHGRMLLDSVARHGAIEQCTMLWAAWSVKTKPADADFASPPTSTPWVVTH